jgi:hypothetical protein
LCLVAAIGTRISEAMVKRQAAMTNEGTSSWAKRMKIEAVETARIPTAIATIGGTGGRLGEFMTDGQL